MNRTLAALFLFAAAPAAGAPPGPRRPVLSALLRQEFEKSKTVLDDRSYSLWTSRLRTSADWSRGPFKAEVQYDVAGRLGPDYFASADAAAAVRQSPRSQLRFGDRIDQNADRRIDSRFHRGWVRVGGENWELKGGRQRTTWSPAEFFSVIDFPHLAVPYDPYTDLEPLDSIFVRLGPLSGEVIPRAGENNWEAIGRIGLDRGKTRLGLYGGKVREERAVRGLNAEHPRLMAGAALSYANDEGRLTVEQAYFDSNLTPDFYRTLVSIAAGDHVLFEYHHNGAGAARGAYDFLSLVRGDAGVLGRNYLALRIGAGETLRGTWNVDDGSWTAELGLHRTIGRFTLAAGWQWFGGDAFSEFGPLANRTWANAAWELF